MAITETQRDDRVNYIGGSDIAGVLGLSRWMSPLKIWAQKTKQIPADDLSDSQAVELGNELEDVVCRLFTKRTGKKVYRVNETLFHPNYPFIGANIDRRVVGEDAIFEAKTCSAWRAKEFDGEELPVEYILQVLHYLAVSGKSVGYLGVLIGGQDFRWRSIQRDDKVIQDMLRKAVHFWKNFVETKEMPSQITKNDAETLYGLFPVGDESAPIELTDQANIILENLDAYKADLRVLEGNIDRSENELKAMLGDNAVGLTEKYRVTWKNQIQKRVDTKRLKEELPDVSEKYSKTIESRVLRVSGIKSKEK